MGSRTTAEAGFLRRPSRAAIALAVAGAVVGGVVGASGPARASEAPAPSVVGGHDAPPGKWPDAVAVYVGSLALCTGVLVAPTVVLTAAHCNTSGLTEVKIGADALSAEGERIPVAKRIEYPTWDTSFDVLVLVLARPSQTPPRPLAAGWAASEITNGTLVNVVGFGAVNAAGNVYVDRLQEATTAVTDDACDRVQGCNANAAPWGELGAGGMGVDSCSGDSGGPLYAETSYGTVVAALTSRSYDDARLPCSEGGIYVRAGRIADWIERVAGVPILRTPGPSAGELELAVGAGDQVTIAVNDERSRHHRFELARPPALGKAAVHGDGTVRMCGEAAGRDELVVAVIDRNDARRRAYVPVPIEVRAGVDDGDCSVELDDGCGCNSATPGAAAPWALLVLLLGARHRRADRRKVRANSDPGNRTVR